MSASLNVLNRSTVPERQFSIADDAPRSFHRASSNSAAILEKPVSDRGTLEDLSQSGKSSSLRVGKLLILNGEMSEWLIEHAWKTTPASRIEWYQNISLHKRFNDFPPQNASRCEPVNVAVCQRFRGDLTQFLHSSLLHLNSYVAMFPGACLHQERPDAGRDDDHDGRRHAT